MAEPGRRLGLPGRPEPRGCRAPRRVLHPPRRGLPRGPRRQCRPAGFVVLAQLGSVPGIDDIPYEVLHHGAGFVAHLVGQAILGLVVTPYSLDRVLGADPDLLVWIPKGLGLVRTTETSRPLQLPTTLLARHTNGALMLRD